VSDETVNAAARVIARHLMDFDWPLRPVSHQRQETTERIVRELASAGLLRVPAVDRVIEAAGHALRHFVHLDESNAAIHTAQVRYSPITFRLAEALAPYAGTLDSTAEVARVIEHVGLYEEDSGR